MDLPCWSAADSSLATFLAPPTNEMGRSASMSPPMEEHELRAAAITEEFDPVKLNTWSWRPLAPSSRAAGFFFLLCLLAPLPRLFLGAIRPVSLSLRWSSSQALSLLVFGVKRKYSLGIPL